MYTPSQRVRKGMGRMSLLAAVMLVGGLLAPGCYDPDTVEKFLLKPRAAVSGVEYRVYPPDVIAVSSLHVSELRNVRQQVSPDGKVNLPLLGEIYVAGKTPLEIQADVAKAASKYYEEADATVTVVGYQSQKFYLWGQVSRPGPMAWTGRDTLLDALSKSQPTNLGWPERITVSRCATDAVGGTTRPADWKPSKKYTFTGVHSEDDAPRYSMTINLMAMVKSGDMSNNILLMPNDIIYVQPNPLAAIGLAIQNVLFPIRPAIQTAGVPASAATAVAMP